MAVRKHTSRRDFLRIGILGTSAALLAACSPQAPAAQPTVAPAAPGQFNNAQPQVQLTPTAAAAARISANEAFFLAAKENIQVHGGMGFTWEFDCHLYYRRAKLLSLALGSTRLWKDRLITQLETANAPL